MPRVVISAARVTVFKDMPVRDITAMAMAMQTGTPELAMRADRRGNSMSITKITTSMEIRRSRRKLQTLVFTTWGWSLTRMMPTSSGTLCRNSCSTFSTSSP